MCERTSWVNIAGAVFVALLAGCAALPQPEVRPPTATVPAEYGPPSGAGEVFLIEDAELEIHTYRAGWLANLAHNHVLATTEITGTVLLAEPRAGSRASLYFRPWDLVLDEPASRAAAGPGFESERTAEDIAATRTRMLGPRGFHSNAHPFVRVDVHWLNEASVALDIHFRATTLTREIPVAWQLDGDTLRAQADFELSHRSLGIRPYSAFAGAIAVAEPIRVQLRLTARRSDRV